jgi:hypothetical protein
MPPTQRWLWAEFLAIVIASVWGLVVLSSRAAVHEKVVLAAISSSGRSRTVACGIRAKLNVFRSADRWDKSGEGPHIRR